MANEDLVLRTATQPGVVTLTFNRPDKLNALSVALLDRLDAHLTAIASDRDVRVVILRGAGPKAFVAGADIADYQGRQYANFVAYQLRSRELFDRLECLAQPTLAVVDGYALGGGFEIVLCCDLIVCTTRAQLGLPEGRLGLSPGGGGTRRLTQALGKHAAADVMLAGWRMDGARAWQLGLACCCVEPAELEEAVAVRVRALLKQAPLAQAQMKRLMREGVDASAATAKSYEQEVLFRLYNTTDGQEGIDAFLAKREPKFKGE